MTRDELLALIDQAAAEGWTELDLSGQGLTELPPEIGKLTQLETLILGKVDKWEYPDGRLTPKLITNALSTLPPELGGLKQLKVLNLSGNPLEQVPDVIFQLESLTGLNATAINLFEIPEGIAQLPNLTELDLGSNQITTIPECIAQLSNLTVLYLYSNQITTISESIAQLSNLTELALSSNQITTIPECIAQLSNLTILALYSNQITTIPECIAQLSNLTVLDLSSNQITTIPESIAQLSNLTVLYLGINQITTIPESIAQLSNLTKLYLYSNQITSIPEGIAQLSNLTILYLSSNQITTIPECIAQLSNLMVLYLWGNQITSIPESIAQLSNLTILYLYSNQITTIPESIAQLSNLTELYLSSNQITTIPESIAQLSNLTKLYLSSNQITTIPESIAQLSNLTVLSLHSNQITEISECIAQLSNLTKLDLENNQIETCPDWLEDLPKLETLDLRRNPLPISPEILESTKLSKDPGSVADIFGYLRKLRSGEVRPLNEAKLLLVGQGSVGKTSLVKQLLDGHYNPNEPQTDGLSVRNWGVHVNSKDVRLNVWDFGGQEIYHATHQFFLTKRSLYLLVCNCRTSEEENRIEYWLKLIQTFGGESPVIIVGNKKDEQPFDINRKALRDKYPNICAILETSCQSGDGIEELREAIREEVGKLHDVYNLLPLSWFEVKEQLEALDRDFISYGEYIGICYQHQISEERSQEQLITLLHNLGLVLNFREHPVLQNTNVLNPDWVTAGIYALLSDDTLKTESQGILDTDDLSRVLAPPRYPPERHRYLTDLMQEFQLCFALPDCPCPRFLIPGLLPKEEPADISLEGDTLEFQYHYRVWLGVVLYRFIVLSHEKIHHQTCWRSGVMLQYCEGDETCNIARIKADPEDKKIFISISGRETTRRIFLSLIRDTFTKIHKSFADLEVTEWVPVPDHPDHPPLEYKNLLGLEKMGVRDYPIGTLGIMVNLRQLLDGYEPFEARQSERFKERGMEDMGMPSFPLPSRLPDIGIRPLASPKRGKAIPQERTELYQFALDLPSSQFDTVVFDLAPPKGNMPPVGSPQSQRVTALFEWLESPIGPGLAALRAALAKVTGWLE